MTIVVKKITTKKELEICLAIRKQVFVMGQRVPLHEELDGKDIKSDHYLLYLDQVPVGVLRVRYIEQTAKIERVAVLESYQGKGLGNHLMKFVMTEIKKNTNTKQVKLSSQVYAIPFYEKLGFQVVGEEYLDANIPHKDMIMHL